MDEMIQRLSRRVNDRNRQRRGQTLVEYALILSFISVVAIATLMSLGSQVKSAFTTVSSQLAVAKTGGAGSGSGSSGSSGTTGG